MLLPGRDIGVPAGQLRGPDFRTTAEVGKAADLGLEGSFLLRIIGPARPAAKIALEVEKYMFGRQPGYAIANAILIEPLIVIEPGRARQRGTSQKHHVPAVVEVGRQGTKPGRGIDLGIRKDIEEEAMRRERERIDGLASRQEGDAEPGLSQRRGQFARGVVIHPGQVGAEHRDVPEAAAVDNHARKRGRDTRWPLGLCSQRRRVQRQSKQPQNVDQHSQRLHRPLLFPVAFAKSGMTPWVRITRAGRDNHCLAEPLGARLGSSYQGFALDWIESSDDPEEK